jgi:hypothetical protein
MPAPTAFDYALVRVVPCVDRGELLNVGALLFARTRRYLGARIELDEARLRALWPAVDLDDVRAHLDVIPRVCRGGPEAGPIGELPLHERFHWLVAPRSTIIQTSAVHSGLCDDPARELARLVERMVRLPGATGAAAAPSEPAR